MCFLAITVLCVKSEGGTCGMGCWCVANVQVCKGGGSGTGRMAEEIKLVDSLVGHKLLVVIGLT